MKPRNTVLCAALAAILLPTTVVASTTKNGVIDGEVWDLAGSPYLIDGDIFVEDLIIQPGVRVELQGAFAFEITPTATCFVAAGTEYAPIVFTHEIGLREWLGIRFNATMNPAALLVMEHCRVELANDTGVKITNCYPVLNHCSFTNNHSATGSGGGMVILLDGPPGDLVLDHCYVNNNKCDDHGGGIYATLSSSNSSLTFVDCEVNNNRANKDSVAQSRYGGGMYIADAAGDVVLERSEVNGNYAYSYGGHSYCYGGGIYVAQGAVSLLCCTIDGNTTFASCSGTDSRSYSYGAGIHIGAGAMMLLRNCIVSYNSPVGGASGYSSAHSRRGGGIYSSGVISLENTTVAYNTEHGIYNSGGIATGKNSIVYGNGTASISGGATVTYSDVQGGYTGQGNIDVDPWFASLFDLEIVCGSPCVDMGNPDPYYNDLAFPPSCGTEINDMGAHGGPHAGGWFRKPVVDLKAMGADGVVTVANGTLVDLTLTLEAGSYGAQPYEWWFGAATPLGVYWMQANGTFSPVPTPVWPTGVPILRLQDLPVLTFPMFTGVWSFFFVLDDTPNGVLDSVAWYDMVEVCVN